MKIVFLITRSDTIGGAHIHVRDLCRNFFLDGHEVVVLIGGNGRFIDILKETKVEVIPLKYLKRNINPFFDFLAFKELRRVLKKVEPDILSIHSSKAGLLGRLAAIKLNFPVTFTVHGWSFTEGISSKKRVVFLFLEKILAPLANKIISVSDYDRNLAIKYKVADKKRIVTVLNGMPKLVNNSNISTQDTIKPKFLMVARFDEQKDHKLLLRAVKEVPEIYIDLIGDGPDLSKVKKFAKELDLLDRVNFLGEIRAGEEIFANYHIYLLISKWEGLPLSIIEAMRSGLAVICSDVGGCSEEIIDGINGFLIPRSDEKTLINRLKLLSKDAGLRKKMGKEGLRIYKEKFTLESMYNKNLSIYKSLVNDK